MIFSSLPPENSVTPDGNAQTDNRQEQAPLPFYRRPFFWLFIGLLVGAILLLLLYFWQIYKKDVPDNAPPTGTEEPAPQATQEESPGPDAAPKEDKDAAMRELLELQRAQNRGLEEEIKRLQQLLQEDPCALPGLLGSPPNSSQVAPGYAPPARVTPLPQTPGEGSKDFSPSVNGTQVAPVPGDVRSPAPSSLPAPATVGELMDKATVFILSNSDGQIGMGSGFFVAPGIIATNSHVVQSPDAKVIVGNKALGGMQKATLIAFDKRDLHDYALLRVNNELAAKAPVLMLAEGAGRMERVSAWGFPGYIAEIDPKLKALAQGDSQAVPEVVYSEGVVSVVLERTPPVILHTASISQGNSGGPLVNAQGVVVGINTFIKQADKSYSQTNIALPGNELAKFIKEQGIQPALAGK